MFGRKSNVFFLKYNKDFIKIRSNGSKVTAYYDPHPLTGNWKNYMECHIEDDFLLIWYDRVENKIELVRLGTHSELFCKGRKK